MDLSPIRTRPIVVVADTDLHGVALAAALVKALAATAGEENLAILSHFDPRGPASTPRGDLPALIKQLAAAVTSEHSIYFADVALKIGAEKATVEALAELASRAARIVYIDHHVEVVRHFAEAGIKLPGIDYRIYADAFSTYMPALMTAVAVGDMEAARHIYDLAVLGLVADLDLEALPVAQKIGASLGFETPSMDEIRRNYHVVVAIDSVIKSPRKPTVETDVALVGNMAAAAAWLAKKPLAEIAQEALQIAPTPEPAEVAKESELVKGIVAVYKKQAPVGQGFKYAALLEAATDAPIVLVAAPVPKVTEYVVLLAAPNAFLGTEITTDVQRLLSEVKESVIRELKERGFTRDEWIRPGPSFAIPVDSKRWEEALGMVAERLAALWAEKRREKFAAEVAKEELTILVADEKLAASVARIVEAAVEAAVKRVEQLLKERR